MVAPYNPRIIIAKMLWPEPKYAASLERSGITKIVGTTDSYLCLLNPVHP